MVERLGLCDMERAPRAKDFTTFRFVPFDIFRFPQSGVYYAENVESLIDKSSKSRDKLFSRRPVDVEIGNR